MALLSAFNPHDFSEATVRAIATGRQQAITQILTTIRDNLQAPTIQHLILSAPRGYGKSFMMRHAQIEAERIARDDSLPIAVVLMPEEMPHVKEPETLIRELTRALTGAAGSEAELTWHEDDGAAWEAAVDELDKAILGKVGPRGLLVAEVENFDVLLRRAFPKEVQASRLRAFLTESGRRLMLIAASASGAFDRSYDDRLFHAFREIQLEPWSVEDCLAFFGRQRADAGKPPLAALTQARARAVASFIGGTPRLATLLGDALFDEDVLGAAELLQRLIDDLTPYYKERIEALPGRAQKLLDALLRGGEPATQSEIAQRVKANAQAAIAAPFNDLVRERIVVGERAPHSAEVLYRVADRVFAHYYRRRIIDHGKTACPLEALVELLAEYFSAREKQAKAAEFARIGRLEEARLMARLSDEQGIGRNGRWYVLYDLANYYIPRRLIPLASEPTADDLRAIAACVKGGAIDRAYREIARALVAASDPQDRALLLFVQSRINAYEGIEDGLAAAEQAAAIAGQPVESGVAFEAVLAKAWSLAGMTGRHTESLDLMTPLIDRLTDVGAARELAIASRMAAHCLHCLGRHGEAVEMANRAADLAEKSADIFEGAIALTTAAWSLMKLDRHEEAVAAARQAVELAKRAGDNDQHAQSLRLLAVNLAALGDAATAIDALASAAVIGERERDRQSLVSASDWMARESLDAALRGASALDTVHTLLRAAAEKLDFDGMRRLCLDAALTELTGAAVSKVYDPGLLEALAAAIDLHFHGRFAVEISRLRDAARYHDSGRDPGALARVDPDEARMLMVMFPPGADAAPRKKRGSKR